MIKMTLKYSQPKAMTTKKPKIHQQDHIQVNAQLEDGNEIDQPNEGPKTPKQLVRELKDLQQPFNNAGQSELERQTNQFCFFVPENIEEGDDTPTSFQEAWHHKNCAKRAKWRDAICLEFQQMRKNGVWKNKGVNNLPPNRKGIGTKWVFKEKKNGLFRARLVVKV